MKITNNIKQIYKKEINSILSAACIVGLSFFILYTSGCIYLHYFLMEDIKYQEQRIMDLYYETRDTYGAFTYVLLLSVPSDSNHEMIEENMSGFEQALHTRKKNQIELYLNTLYKNFYYYLIRYPELSSNQNIHDFQIKVESLQIKLIEEKEYYQKLTCKYNKMAQLLKEPKGGYTNFFAPPTPQKFKLCISDDII